MAGVCIVHVVDITLAPRNEKDKYMLQEEKREEKRKPMERILVKLEVKKDEDIIKSTESNIEDLILEKNFMPNEGTSQQHKQLNRKLSNLVPRVRRDQGPLHRVGRREPWERGWHSSLNFRKIT